MFSDIKMTSDYDLCGVPSCAWVETASSLKPDLRTLAWWTFTWAQSSPLEIRDQGGETGAATSLVQIRSDTPL